MKAIPLVVLGRRAGLYKEIADWQLSGVEVFLFDSPSEALARVAAGDAGIFLFDSSGFTRFRHVVRKFLSLRSDTDLLVLGDLGPLLDDLSEPSQGVVRALASDIPPADLRIFIERLLKLREVRAKSGIVGRSRAVAEVLSLIAHAAPLDVTVLIQGESGTGKELVARAIHAHSQRHEGPFLSLNCGAMSEGVLESELFGHAKGAFTGAVAAHDGVFRRADGGSLFLDEVAEMPLGMQTRFLRSLETGEFTPVGGRQTLRSDIRLIAATHRELAREVGEGRFRQDLYYRLRVVVITTPPLRERPEDVVVLAQNFLEQENARHSLSVRGLARSSLRLLESYDWPGNVRELRNVISATVAMKQTGMIEAADLPVEVRQGSGGEPGIHLPMPVTQNQEQLERQLLTSTLLELREDVKEIKAYLQRQAGQAAVPGPVPVNLVEAFPGDSAYSPVPGTGGGDLQEAEKVLIEAALQATGGHRKKAAQRLGISERTLYRKIKRYGL